ncbi:unnamed protein product [Adineta steineri]|uniref:Uncharacterized protein n=1 Tax=Adineta steineri TaxID=433720 RepID=A0A819F9P2_9BILA|nr:unnamed protein product [Adineta steineri]
MASGDGGILLGLQDPDNTPPGLSEKARNWLQNYNYQQQFAPECREYIYDKPSKPWSLQNAILYAANSLLDKSQTENNWFSMLDPKYTTLTPAKLENMINYAVYDCINVAYLRLPMAQRWSLYIGK